MTKEKTYQGYANYETWAISLWMGSDQASYEHFRELARDVAAFANGGPSLSANKQTSGVIELAKALRDEFEAGSPVADQATVYADLMNAAFSEVDWYELAEELLREITEEETR